MVDIKMVVTDLDGTLYNSKGEANGLDLDTLHHLAKMGVPRVIATGRSLWSAEAVIPANFPIDYLVFSSGAGVMRWSTKEVLHSRAFSAHQVRGIIDELCSHDVDFMIHEPIPHNHCFLYRSSGKENPDFNRRIVHYQQFCRPLIQGVAYEAEATQLLAVLPNDVDWFSELKAHFPAVKVIRTTSPMDGSSIWMEIFPEDVSKASGIAWLCDLLAISAENVMAVGNDFNDVDMLDFAGKSFVVANAHPDLQKIYPVVSSNDSCGFSHAVQLAFGV